jgi:hypothetical protein
MSGAIWDNLGVIFAAFVVLLIVRVANRRERTSRGKSLIAVGGIVALAALYVFSFGPACWLVDGHFLPREAARRVYLPLTIMIARSPDSVRLYFIEYSKSRLAPLPRNVEAVGLKWILESY